MKAYDSYRARLARGDRNQARHRAEAARREADHQRWLREPVPKYARTLPRGEYAKRVPPAGQKAFIILGPNESVTEVTVLGRVRPVTIPGRKAEGRVLMSLVDVHVKGARRPQRVAVERFLPSVHSEHGGGVAPQLRDLGGGRSDDTPMEDESAEAAGPVSARNGANAEIVDLPGGADGLEPGGSKQTMAAHTAHDAHSVAPEHVLG